MKVITLKQPFASLVAEGYKEYEFRTWKTKYRGDILIHAGKGIDKNAMKRYTNLNLEYPSGVIIAKATLTDCIKVDEEFKSNIKNDKNDIYHNVTKENSTYSGYAFKLEKITKIKNIPINGKLSLWEYNGNIDFNN